MILDELKKLSKEYPAKYYVFNTSKADFVAYLNEIIEVLEELPDEFSMPEGPEGLLIYLILKNKAYFMEDAGEFMRQLQGTELIFKKSIEALIESRRASGEFGW